MADQATTESRLRRLERAIRDILDKLGQVEALARRAIELAGRGQGGDAGNGTTVYATVTTAVTGRTATNLGFGFALIDGDYNFTSGAITAGSGDPVKFWTRWSGAVPAGTLVELDLRRGQWWLQGNDCP